MSSGNGILKVEKAVREYSKLIRSMDGNLWIGYYEDKKEPTWISPEVVSSFIQGHDYLSDPNLRRYKVCDKLERKLHELLDIVQLSLEEGYYGGVLEASHLEEIYDVLTNGSVLNGREKLIRELKSNILFINNPHLHEYIGRYFTNGEMLEISGLINEEQRKRIEEVYPKTTKDLRDAKDKWRLIEGNRRYLDEGDIEVRENAHTGGRFIAYEITRNNCVILLKKERDDKKAKDLEELISELGLESSLGEELSAKEIAEVFGYANTRDVYSKLREHPGVVEQKGGKFKLEPHTFWVFLRYRDKQTNKDLLSDFVAA